jgi:hypothetical protein
MVTAPYPNLERKTGWADWMKADPIATMRREITQAIGELEASKRLLFEKVEAVHRDLVMQRMICPLGGCAGSMGCACPC